MKILMLVNWKIDFCETVPCEKQPPDFYVKGDDYWFYRYFSEKPEVDVLDISSVAWIESFEKNKLRFYVVQALRAIPRLNQYDLIVSHGMQSGVLVSLWRRFFKGKAKHVVFDIGSFASASTTGLSLKLMQFSSKSIDGVIYHTSSQKTYYQQYFPWVVQKSQFLRFGTDLKFFNRLNVEDAADKDSYILCVGYAKRDWDTLVKAYQQCNTNVTLRLVGYVDEQYKNISGVQQVPFVPIRELINQITNAKFCVLPLESFNYSYGQMTLMQQMALSKCVLMAAVPSLVDYSQDGETVIWYQPKSTTDLAQKMQILLDSPQVNIKIGAQARTFLQAECNEEIMAQDIENFYLRICK